MSPCDTCHAGCCRAFAVPIMGADILLIEKQLNLDFWDFVCRWADPEGTISRGYAPQFHFSDEPETPFVISLKQVQSELFPGTDKCRFLMECPPEDGQGNGTARCGIYHTRPGACRAFPARLNETGELAILYDIPESGRDSDEPIYDLCPRKWEPSGYEPVSGVQDLVVSRYEVLFFRKLAAIWNKQPQSWLRFPDFLRNVYSKRVQADAPVVSLPHPQLHQLRVRAA